MIVGSVLIFLNSISISGEYRKGGLFGAKTGATRRWQKSDDSCVENVLHDSVWSVGLLFQRRRCIHGEFCRRSAYLHPERQVLGCQRVPKAGKRLQAGCTGNKYKHEPSCAWFGSVGWLVLSFFYFQDGAEYLFSAGSEEKMHDWVAKINFHAQLPPSLQLKAFDPAQQAPANRSTSGSFSGSTSTYYDGTELRTEKLEQILASPAEAPTFVLNESTTVGNENQSNACLLICLFYRVHIYLSDILKARRLHRVLILPR